MQVFSWRRLKNLINSTIVLWNFYSWWILIGQTCQMFIQQEIYFDIKKLVIQLFFNKPPHYSYISRIIIVVLRPIKQFYETFYRGNLIELLLYKYLVNYTMSNQLKIY